MLGDACWLHFLFGSSYVTFFAFLVSRRFSWLKKDLLCLSREVQKHLEPEQNVQTLGGDHTLVHRCSQGRVVPMGKASMHNHDQ